MKAYVFVNVAVSKPTDVVQELRRIPGVTSADICWGLPDIIVAVEAVDAKALQDLVLDKVQKITNVNETDTHIVCET